MKTKSYLKPTGAFSLIIVASLLLMAGLNSVIAQITTEFEFNEGAGATVTDKTYALWGELGTQVYDPADMPVVSPGSPSMMWEDTSITLNGVGYLAVDDRSGPILAKGPLTIECWWYDSGWALSDFTLASYGSSGLGGPQSGYAFLVDEQGMLAFQLIDVVTVSSGLAVPFDLQWHHLAVAYEPGVGVTFYIDGLVQTNFVQEVQLMRAPLSNFLRIGAWVNGGMVPAGSIDRFRIHKALLTAEQLDSEASNPKPPLASTLVAYNFDQAAPPFTNAAPAIRPALNYNELLSNAPRFVSDSPSGAAGDYSLSFNKVERISMRVEIADPVGYLTVLDGDLTIQLWVKIGEMPGNAVPLCFGDGSGYYLWISTDRKIQIVFPGKGAAASQKAEIPNDGGWHHIAVVHVQGQEVRFYVDGILKDTQPYTGGVGLPDKPVLVLGSHFNTVGPFGGLIDRLKISIYAAVNANDLDWRLVPGVEPTAPQITIVPAVVISWPPTVAEFVLQSTTQLEVPGSWADIAKKTVSEGGIFKLYDPMTDANKFYRLIQAEK